GGPMINDLLARLGIESRFVRGKRVTTKETVEVVEMVLSGLVNKRIVQAINDAGGRAVGISGKDDDMMVCEADDPELGFVGRPVEMNIQIIRDLYNAGMIPVCAPVATGMEDNETFNVNGDTAAGAIAGALRADRLLLLTDVAGVKDQSGEVLTQLHPDQVREMIGDGRISGGMIPKTETALQAIDEGVRAVVILDGRVPHACLLELFTEHGAGSLIRSTEPRIKAHGLRQGEDGL
ncbi:MAG: acetylglutamate kinase, partial [Paracoccus sp. (in: a-proteobacteria)]